MLTKRAFLGGAGALVALPTAFPFEAMAESGDCRIVQAAASLAAQGPATPIVRIDGTGAEHALRLALAQRSEVRFANALSEPVALAWRGLRGTGDLDRQVMTTVQPGSAGAIEATPRDSGTILLRAAPAATQLAARGLQAAVVVPEPSPPVVDHDLVIMLQDWLLAADNSLRFGSTPPRDVVSACVTINGDTKAPQIAVQPRARLRLRFVNGSVQRLMILGCSGGRPMIAAIDGQPCNLFAPNRNAVPVGPGARYDLLLDAPDSAGAEVRFTLKPTLTVGGKMEAERDLLLLRTDGVALPAKPPLAPLPPNPNLPTQIPLERAVRADLSFGVRPAPQGNQALAWSVNGRTASAAERPVLTAKRGDAVVLGLINDSATLVPLRIGGHAVRLLHARDDGWEPYWRDTLLLPPKSRNHVAFVADTPGRWAIDSGFDDFTLAGLSCCFGVTRG